MPPVPLNPLRVFVLASRHDSFVEAADALHVTPGAVSRQVKALEDFLGVHLYTQGANRKELTDAGRHLSALVGPWLDEIESAATRFASAHRQDSLRLSCSNHFMRQWLLPRLGGFLERHPQFEVNFEVARAGEAIDRTADVVIRYGRGHWPGFDCRLLLQPDLIPVCSPAYLASHGPIAAPADLLRHTLLQSRFRPEDWRHWFGKAGQDMPQSLRCVTFTGTYLAYQAATLGNGIALGRRGMIEKDIAAGLLVAPLPIWCDIDAGFYLCTAAGAAAKRSVTAFCRWVAAEVAAA